MQAHKIIFLMGWVRSTNPEQRCRTIIASNPPMAGDGDFLVEWFAPWLDPTYPDPAEPGELRWAVFVGDEHEIRSIWVDGPDPVEIEGQRREPESRTFIPSTLDDNRYLRDTDYSKKLDSLPEPMRSALKSGNFMASRKDHQWQVIPSDWIRLAQERWREDGGRHIPMWCLAADIAQGGNDKTTLAPLHDQWFGNLGVHKGIETKNGPDVAAPILA
ncbi:MAG: terminase, partial [Cohaesibacteraceae bacterium]|nr:terminase [Cohaesibacteraceae bacterium]